MVLVQTGAFHNSNVSRKNQHCVLSQKTYHMQWTFTISVQKCNPMLGIFYYKLLPSSVKYSRKTYPFVSINITSIKILNNLRICLLLFIVESERLKLVCTLVEYTANVHHVCWILRNTAVSSTAYCKDIGVRVFSENSLLQSSYPEYVYRTWFYWLPFSNIIHVATVTWNGLPWAVVWHIIRWGKGMDKTFISSAFTSIT